MLKDNEKVGPGDAGETVTCPHCRYEYPAKEEVCSICGYPWPWLPQDEEQ